MTPPRRAIIIGGGPAGLIAAATLAGAGTQTTLLEATATFGGRAASKRQGGFDLNQGAHALYAGGPAMRELTALGIDPPRWNPTSHRSVFVRGGRARRLPGATPAVVRALAPILRGRPDGLHELTVEQWLAQALPDPAARAAAAALVRLTTFVADHDALSADVAATQLRIAVNPGVRYILGGWSTIVDALAGAARDRGATLRTRARVRTLARIDGDDEWAVGIDQETLGADVVVLAAGGPEVAASLLGDRAPAPPRAAAEVSALDLGLQRLPRRSATFGLGIDRPAYISRHSPPGHPGGVLMSLIGYAGQPRSELDAFAEIVAPGWRDRVMFERFLPRMIAVSALATPEHGGLQGRPAVDRGDGLYLAGDWVGPEGWLLDAALASGTAAAAAALRRPIALAATA